MNENIQSTEVSQLSPKDVFISYTSEDRQWAEWIAWCLEQEHYTAIIQAWDFLPGSNFIHNMDQALKQAERVIAVLSPSYFDSRYGTAEWMTTFRDDPLGERGLLLPVCVEPCEIEGLLGSIVYIDLVKCDEQTARERLLSGIRQKSIRPTYLSFPGPSQAISARPAFPDALPTLWNIPYPRNPFFTNREELLMKLYTTLRMKEVASPSRAQAINGIGGIGKTQTVVEYAYRYHRHYQAIFWTPADTRTTLISAFIAIAGMLGLPVQNEQDSNVIIAAVKNWLHRHSAWLLIFDNADDLVMVREFLPAGSTEQHILLTTRAQSIEPLARSLELDEMDLQEGTLLLLRRTKALSPSDGLDQVTPEQRAEAEAIVKALSGLPLALDQAGAYIDETQCGLSGYLDLYHARHQDLLRWQSPLANYPGTVETTWSLSFQKIEQVNPAAADLLRLCAFFNADAIPEEIFTKGYSDLGPVLKPIAMDMFKLNEAIRELRKFSLVRRDPDTKTLTVHRLVQLVLIDKMKKKTKQQWAERAVRAVYRAFPDAESADWQDCQRYIPHIQACMTHIEQWNIKCIEASRLLDRAGFYLWKRGQYDLAESFYGLALKIGQETFGVEHPDIALYLNDLALLYRARGKYGQSEQLMQHALTIREQVLDPLHPDIASSLHNLGVLYDIQGKYEQAEQLLQRALAIREQVLGSLHPYTAITLSNLGMFYLRQRKYDQAESFQQRSLTILEQVLDPLHPDIATSLNDLGFLYRTQGKYEQAEPLIERALAIREKVLGPLHSNTAISLNNLAGLYRAQGKYEQAEPLMQRALAIREQVLGPEHRKTATSLASLALLYREQGKYEQAEPLMQRALAIREQVLGPEHRKTATSLASLALLYREQGKYEQAEPLMQRALAIREQVLGPEHVDTANALNSIGMLYYMQGKYEKAEPLWQRALTIYEQKRGPEHSDTALMLNNLGMLYLRQGNYEQAESCLQQGLDVRERVLGLEHPNTLTTLEMYVDLLRLKKRYLEAATLESRMKNI